jgi:hypothetical protein
MTFYAHYSENTGKILAVAGRPMPDDHPDATIIELEEEIAIKFMTHEWQMSDWVYGKKYGMNTAILTQDMTGLIPPNLGAMVELPRFNNIDVIGVRARLTLSEDLVEFYIPEHFKGKPFEYIEDDTLTFVLTKRNDPTFVITEFVVPVDKLFETGLVSLTYDLELNDYSMFTNRMFIHYQLEVNAVPKHVSKEVTSSRINHLVAYKNEITKAGIQATHDPKTNTLILEIVGKTKLNWPLVVDDCLLFITKLNDPTIIYDAVSFNIELFWLNRIVTLQLPKDIDQAFGVASYPLSSDLAFTRKPNGKRKKTNNRV